MKAIYFPSKYTLGIHQVRMTVDVSLKTVVLAIGMQTWSGTWKYFKCV